MVDIELNIAGIAKCHGAVLVDASPAVLVEEALRKNEGILTDTGALAVETGSYTGRSPKDRFIVDTPDVHDNIAWGAVNIPFAQEHYKRIKNDCVNYLS
ncbi:MAG: phosphoenolpyruvate carboxykinase (ATP), partial [Atopobium minutum]|nr:phosphoenolpyruvate carboxykinase (ATP) [Atopobium minutum]